jgi:hypothetical protein
MNAHIQVALAAEDEHHFAARYGAMIEARASRMLSDRKLLGREVNGRPYWTSEWDTPATAALFRRRMATREDYLRTHAHSVGEAVACAAAVRALERMMAGECALRQLSMFPG